MASDNPKSPHRQAKPTQAMRAINDLRTLSRDALASTHELRRGLRFIKKRLRSFQELLGSTDYQYVGHVNCQQQINTRMDAMQALVDECISDIDDIVETNNRSRREAPAEHVSLYQLELSPPVLKLLRSAGISNIENLTNKSANQLLLIPNFSKRNLIEIQRKLARHRMSLSIVESKD